MPIAGRSSSLSGLIRSIQRPVSAMPHNVSVFPARRPTGAVLQRSDRRERSRKHLCYTESASHKLDATRRQIVGGMPRVGGDLDLAAENEGWRWAGDDARHP